MLGRKGVVINKGIIVSVLLTSSLNLIGPICSGISLNCAIFLVLIMDGPII